MVGARRGARAEYPVVVLDRAYEVLSKPGIGPQGLKAAIASTVLAADQLKRAGFDVASAGDQVAPKILIVEMTAAEVEVTRAAVEAEHRENFGGAEDDDELAEDMDGSTPQLAAA